MPSSESGKRLSFWIFLFVFSSPSALPFPPQLASEQQTEMRESLDDSLCLLWPSVPVANWFLVLEVSARSSLVTVYYKGLFSRDPKDLRDTVSELYLEQVLSWPALGWSSDRELIHLPRSLQTPVPACRTVMLFEASCFQEVVVIPWGPLAVSF